MKIIIHYISAFLLLFICIGLNHVVQAQDRLNQAVQNQRTHTLSLGGGWHTFTDEYSANFRWSAFSPVSPVVRWHTEKYRPTQGRLSQLNVQYQYTNFKHPVLPEREEVQFASHKAVIDYNHLWDVAQQHWFVGVNLSINLHYRLNNFLANGGETYDGLASLGFVAEYRSYLNNDHWVAAQFRLPLASFIVRPGYDYLNLTPSFGTLDKALNPAFQVAYRIPWGPREVGLTYRAEYYRIKSSNRTVYNATQNLLIDFTF